MNDIAPCYIIAEAGVNHNGSEELAHRLIDAAVDAGADAVKFQTFKAEKLVTRQARKAAYQQVQTGEGDQFAMLKALELSDAAHRCLAAYCAETGIEFLSTPFDEESADFLVGLGCRRLKIPSGELTNAPFLRYLAAKGLPQGATSGYELDFDVRYLWMRQKSILGSHFANAYQAERANRLILEKKIRPVLDEVFPFAETALAHELMAQNKHKGKMVIRVQAPGSQASARGVAA